jgi:probable RNA-binding protein EIF1AD
MSGVRRKTKYRKSVETDVLDSLPEPKEGEQIVRVVASRGGNLIEVETQDGLHSLCRLPNRYRKVVWVKRGTLLIVGSCTEDFQTAQGESGKVKFVVNSVVFTDEQVKHIRKSGMLPATFDVVASDSKKASSNSDGDDLLQTNRNRRPDLVLDETSDEDSDDEANEDEEDAKAKQTGTKGSDDQDDEGTSDDDDES